MPKESIHQQSAHKRGRETVPLKPFYLHWSIGNAAKFNFIGGRPSLGILWLSKVVLCCNKVNFVIKVNNFVGKVVLLLAK